MTDMKFEKDLEQGIESHRLGKRTIINDINR